MRLKMGKSSSSKKKVSKAMVNLLLSNHRVRRSSVIPFDLGFGSRSQLAGFQIPLCFQRSFLCAPGIPIVSNAMQSCDLYCWLVVHRRKVEPILRLIQRLMDRFAIETP